VGAKPLEEERYGRHKTQNFEKGWYSCQSQSQSHHQQCRTSPEKARAALAPTTPPPTITTVAGDTPGMPDNNTPRPVLLDNSCPAIAISNSFFYPTSKNHRGFSDYCEPAKFSVKSRNNSLPRLLFFIITNQ